jgi:hypothetical protein
MVELLTSENQSFLNAQSYSNLIEGRLGTFALDLDSSATLPFPPSLLDEASLVPPERSDAIEHL